MLQSLLYTVSFVAFASSQSVDFLSTPGDISVIGMFKVFEPVQGACGGKVSVNSVMYAEAVRWYFKQLNASGDLPVSIGFEAHKTCELDHLAAEEAAKLVTRVLGQRASLIAGVIGPEYSAEAAVVAPVLSSISPEHRLPQVGFSATAASLSDRQNYPNFISVVQNDDLQIEAMVKSMVEMGWSRIAIVFENTILGREASSSLGERAAMAGICVALTSSIDVTNGVLGSHITNIRDKIIHGGDGKSPISGYVFFGSTITANILFSSISSIGIKNAPVALLSESIELDTAAFEDGTGNVIAKTQGTFVVAPPYRIIKEFRDHWRSVFSNASVYTAAVAENPWLQDVYRSIIDCTNCSFIPVTDRVLDSKFRAQPLYVQYAIMAAHALAVSIRNVQVQLCGDARGVCPAMASGFKPSLLNDKLKGMTLEFSTDFKFRLSSLASAGVHVTLAGGKGPLRATSSYQLFNFRQTDAREFGFVKVGDLADSLFTLNKDDIRDYSDGVTETSWPNIRKAQCDVGQRCSECIPRDLPERFILVPGDVYVVGTVPVYDRTANSECGSVRTYHGYQILEAMKFAVAKANEKSGVFSNFFKNMKVGLVVINTCNNEIVTQRSMYDLQKYGLTFPNGTHVNMTGKILGFVGALGSSISIAMAQALTRLRFVQISYASTSPALSDRMAYPNFLRVVTPDNAQARVMLDVVRKLAANYIQIMYSRGAYGKGGLAAVLEAAAENDVCVTEQIEVIEENANYYSYYERLRKNPQAKIVIVIIQSNVIRPLMAAINEKMTKGEFMFIGSEAWAKNEGILIDDSKRNLLGSFSFVLELAHNSELQTHIANIQPVGFHENPWVKLYLESVLNCYYPDSFDKSRRNKCEDVPDFRTDPDFTLAPWDSSAYYATISLLQGAGNHIKLECGDATSLCDAYSANIGDLISRLKSVQLDLYGLGTRLRVFNENGDGNVGYILYNIQHEPDNPQKLVYTRVGQYPLQGTPTFSVDLIVSPEQGGVTSRCPNEQACSKCFPQETTTMPVTSTKEESFNTITLALAGVLGVFLIVIIVLGVILMKKSRKKSTANDTYLHPMERSPDRERPQTADSHHYFGVEVEEHFDYVKGEETHQQL